VSLPGANRRQKYCGSKACEKVRGRAKRERWKEQHRAERERLRLCRRCGTSLTGEHPSRKTCAPCVEKTKTEGRRRGPGRPRGRRPDSPSRSRPIPAYEGFDPRIFLDDVRARDRARMAEARERLRAS
jgi:hypothetical protein